MQALIFPGVISMTRASRWRIYVGLFLLSVGGILLGITLLLR
ncbi:hypothetical protein [Desulfofundulus sp.]